MNPRHWLEVWCNIHMHRQPNPHSVWGFLVRNHGATSKLFHCYSKTHLSIHMFGPHACSGCLRGLATCVIIGELAHLRGRMDGHHFDQQQERGCTTKVDYSWSVLRSILVRYMPLWPPTEVHLAKCEVASSPHPPRVATKGILIKL